MAARPQQQVHAGSTLPCSAAADGNPHLVGTDKAAVVLELLALEFALNCVARVGTSEGGK